MDTSVILSQGLWAGLFAVGLAGVFTAPPRFLMPAFACGFIGVAARAGAAGMGLNNNGATAVAAATVFLTAAALLRRRTAPPAVLASAVIPLGAAIAMFNLIFAVMNASTASGDALTEALTATGANLAKVFATSLAIAIGLTAGMTAMRAFNRDGAADT